jgi:glycosyltransferase involved in cell wall biosynthesis
MIYVCVPAWNEAPTIGLLLWKVRQLFTGFSRDYQLLVVNDGSTDATEEVLAPYARALPLTLVSHRQRQGYGRSLEELLRLAAARTDRPRRDIALTLQADFSDAPEDLSDLVKRIEGGADIALALARAAAQRRVPLARRVAPTLLRNALRLPGVSDPIGTLRGYRLVTIQRVVRESGARPFVTRDGWAADVELLVRTARHARRIDTIAVTSSVREPSRSSRAHPARMLWDALRASLALRAEARRPAAAEEPVTRTAETAGEGPAASAEAEAPTQQRRKRPRRRGRGRGKGRDFSSPSAA